MDYSRYTDEELRKLSGTAFGMDETDLILECSERFLKMLPAGSEHEHEFDVWVDCPKCGHEFDTEVDCLDYQ